LEAACFDLDGTLVDTESLHLQAEVEALRAIGVRALSTGHPRTFGTGLLPGIRTLAEHYGVGPDGLFAAYAPMWEKLVGSASTLMPGAREALTRLVGRGVPLALVTSSDEAHVNTLSSRFPVLRAFRCVITGGDVGRLKPAPDPYLAAARCLGYAPETCVAFEDSRSGVESAVAAGLYTVAVHRDAAARADLAASHHRMSSFLELTAQEIDRLFRPQS
jgi:HAD superfamily hydrolase (TIGR01509 family)